MLRTLKYNLLHGWGLMRLVRLGLGIVMLIEAFYNYDWIVGSLGSILILQSVFNVACCSGAACYSGKLSDTSENKEIVYEEIK